MALAMAILLRHRVLRKGWTKTHLQHFILDIHGPQYVWVLVGVVADHILKVRVPVCSNVQLAQAGGWTVATLEPFSSR